MAPGGGPVHRAQHARGRTVHGDLTFKSAIVATGSAPVRPPIPGLDSPRCVDSTGLLAQTSVPGRLVILGGGIIGCEFASIFNRFRSEVTIIEMLPSLIPTEDADASRELETAFKKRGIALHTRQAVHRRVEDRRRLARSSSFGDGESVECDLMLVAVGRRRGRWTSSGSRRPGVTVEPRRIPTDEHRRTNVPHIYAAGDVAGYWQLAHTASARARSRPRMRMGHEAAIGEPAVPRPIYTDPEIAGVGLTEAQAREQYGDDERRRRALPLGGDRAGGDVR